MKIFFIALLFSIFFLLPVTLAQDTSKGQIYAMSVSPVEPVASETLTISVGIINPSNVAQNYKAQVIVTKEGQVKATNEFQFSLAPGAGTFISPNYVPDDIGEFEIIAKLYDRLGTELRDIRVIKINVISHIGPFDLEITTPSDIVTPGIRMPVILRLANLGNRSADVQTRVVMQCLSQPNTINEFFVFLDSGSSVEKLIGLDTCKEIGLHEISASIIVFNRTWITAVSQILLNESFIELLFELPEKILARAGESKVFDIAITNEGNIPISNLRLFIPRLPGGWVKISPIEITETSSHETVIFIVNITPPADVLSENFTIGISAAADQVLRRKETTLQVLSFEGPPTAEAREIVPPVAGTAFERFARAITSNGLYIGIGVVAIIGLIFLRHMAQRHPRVGMVTRISRKLVRREEPRLATGLEYSEKLKKIRNSMRNR